MSRRYSFIGNAVRRSRSTANLAYGLNAGVPVATFSCGVAVCAGAKRAQVAISNGSANYPFTANGPDLAGCDVGIYKSDGTARSTPTGALLFSWVNQTITGATEWVSPVFDPTSAIGTDGEMVVVWTTPASSTLCTANNVKQGKYNFGTGSINPLPSLSASPNAVMTVRAYCDAPTPQIIVGIDSLTQGYDTTNTLFRSDSAWVKMGRDNGWIVDSCGYPGYTLTGWNAGSKPAIVAGQLQPGAIAMVDGSINDLPLCANLAAYQALLAARVTAWKAAGVSKVVVCTLPPSSTYVANDALRVSINSWLMGGGISGVDATCDVSTVVRDPGTPSQLLPAYDSGDGTHWNTAGHAAVATALAATINTII